jgi:MFS family permease
LEALEKRRKWLSLAAVNLGNFVPPLDTGIMALILPTIAVNLQAPISLVLWVPLTSLIITASFMPIFGRFSDAHGRKRYFILGLALFSIGSYLSGNSLTIYELLIYRVVQSLGGAFILSNGRALIVDAFPPKERGFALGTHVSVIYIGTTIGVAITGSLVNLTQVVGWRYVFYASATIAAVAVPLALLAIRESPKNRTIKTDWLGSITFAGALSFGLVTLTASANGLSSIDFYFRDIRIPFIGYYVYLDTLGDSRHVSRVHHSFHPPRTDYVKSSHRFPRLQDELDVRLYQLLRPLSLHVALQHANPALLLSRKHQGG